MKWSPLIGVVLLLLLGLLTYAVVAPGVRERRNVERAVRAQHPELDHVSCHQPDPLDLTKYICTAANGGWTSCLHISGSQGAPGGHVISRGIHGVGERSSCRS